MRAELENEAASQLDRAIAGQPAGALMAVEPLRIRAGIEQGRSSVADARARFEKCETQARSLSLRFGAR